MWSGVERGGWGDFDLKELGNAQIILGCRTCKAGQMYGGQDIHSMPTGVEPEESTSVSRVKNAKVGCRRNSVGSRTFQLLLLNSPYRPLGPSDENVSPLLWFLVSTVAFP